jgi:hypothetical protein
VRATYWSCDQKSDGTGETRDATVDEASACLRSKLTPPLNLARIKNAVEDGRALAANIIEEAKKSSGNTLDEAKCKKDTTKEWVDGKCIDKTEAGETCVVDGIGWIICPVASFLGKVTDGAYSMAESLLVFEVTNPFSTDAKLNPIYSLWSNIRNVANIAFVMAFFAVIFSQATSFGISAYGIRKMLPRIVAAAILVNLSYYLCVFAIDISNIIGAGLDGLIKALPASTQPSEPDNWESLTSKLLAGGAALGVGAAVAVWATGTLFAFLAFSLLAIITAVAIFLARHVLLIMLIILSPLAFVAFILPGTEKLFDGWRKAFIAMLVMYPLVAVLFAGSQVASRVMLLTADQVTADQAGGDISWLYKLFSLAVLAIPLFGVPWIVKFSGGFIGRVAGMVNDRGKGLVDRARNAGDAGAKIRRAELGSDIKGGVRNLGKMAHLDRAGGWGYNEDGTKKKGLVRSRVARGIGGVVSSPTRVGFGKMEREERMGAIDHELKKDRAKALSDVDEVTGAPTQSAVYLSQRAAGVGGEALASRMRARATATMKEEHNKEVEQEMTRLRSTSYNRDAESLVAYLTTTEGSNEVTYEAAAKILASGTHGASGKKMLAEMLRNKEIVLDDKGKFKEFQEVDMSKSESRARGALAKAQGASKGLVEGAGSDVAFIMSHPDVGYDLNNVHYVEQMVKGTNGAVTNFAWGSAIAGSSSKVLKLAGMHADTLLQQAEFTKSVAEAAMKDTAGFAAADAAIQDAIRERAGIASPSIDLQSGEQLSDGGIIIPKGAAKQSAAPTRSAPRSAGGNFGGFNSEQPSPSASSQAGVAQNDYLGRPTPTKADGTTMTNEEADEYHRRFGGG